MKFARSISFSCVFAVFASLTMGACTHSSEELLPATATEAEPVPVPTPSDVPPADGSQVPVVPVPPDVSAAAEQVAMAKQFLTNAQKEIRDVPVTCIDQLASTLALPGCLSDNTGISVDSSLPAPLQQDDLALRGALSVLNNVQSNQLQDSCVTGWVSGIVQRQNTYNACLGASFTCSSETLTNCQSFRVSSSYITYRLCASPALTCTTVDDDDHPEQLLHCKGTSKGVLGLQQGVPLPGLGGSDTNLSSCSRTADCLVVRGSGMVGAWEVKLECK